MASSRGQPFQFEARGNLLLLTIVVITHIIHSMPGRLQREIKQSRPFECLEVEATVSLARTADALLRDLEGPLKDAGLSPTQYNVLRILRGAGPAGLACREIAERMITRDPDITRLLDRLERQGLVERRREMHDRRVVTTRIRPAGLQLLKSLDRPVVELNRRRLGHLGPRRLRALIALLDAARGGPEEMAASGGRRKSSKQSPLSQEEREVSKSKQDRRQKKSPTKSNRQ
jgi:DNA-binding MarR family transcriptional regulator